MPHFPGRGFTHPLLPALCFGCFVPRAKDRKPIFLSTYCVLGTGLGIPTGLCHLILITALWSRNLLYFADERLDGQREETTWTAEKWRVQVETQAM